MPLRRVILAEGNGNLAAALGHTVEIHCVGFRRNGDINQQFWSTWVPVSDSYVAKPLSFRIGDGTVVRALNEGVMGMRVGGRARIECSSDLAFGAEGRPLWNVPPNSDLVFEVQLVSVAA